MALTSPQDARLYRDEDLGVPEIHELPLGRVAVFSARCPDKEPPNEDAAAVIPVDARATVLVIADGMGAGRAGNVASSIAVKAVRTAIANAVRDDVLLRAAILDGIEHANQAVRELGVGAGTTLAVAEIQDATVRPYHVGDSMVLLVGQRGKIKLQTVSHSPVGFAVESGLLDRAEAMHHEDRHLVSNIVGEPTMRTEVGSAIQIAPRDTLLLASDGLFDNLHLEETIAAVRAGKLERVAKALAAKARKRMLEPTQNQPSKPDDLTFLVYRRAPPPRRQSKASRREDAGADS